MGKSTISMVIFNSSVKLPEGKSLNFIENIWKHRKDRMDGFKVED